MWYKEIKRLLKNEPEDWLSYLHGQQTKYLSEVVGLKPKLNGVFFQLAAYGHWTLFNWLRSTSHRPTKRKSDVLIYAGTNNQAHALSKTVTELKKKGTSVVSITQSGSQCHQEGSGYAPFKATALDVAKGLFLFFARAMPLYQRLKSLPPEAARYYLTDFFKCHMFLVMFQRILDQVEPRFVLVSNDHNAPNRVLLALAQERGIKTCYMQHASVSDLFPALDVNYAFLDGQAALATYRRCTTNHPQGADFGKHPSVFLTGQKKPVRSFIARASRQHLGIALNTLDPLTPAFEAVDALISIEKAVIIRWHPGQSDEDIAAIEKRYLGHPLVTLSYPKQSAVGPFLEQCSAVIAGNSSILLEAILSGANPIYYQFDVKGLDDYYGYCRKGLALRSESIPDLLHQVTQNEEITEQQKKAAQYYSATYATQWEGREGELTADLLNDLLIGKDPANLYGYEVF